MRFGIAKIAIGDAKVAKLRGLAQPLRLAILASELAPLAIPERISRNHPKHSRV